MPTRQHVCLQNLRLEASSEATRSAPGSVSDSTAFPCMNHPGLALGLPVCRGQDSPPSPCPWPLSPGRAPGLLSPQTC